MTPPRLFLQLSARLRRFVVLLLLVALPLHGLSSGLVQLLGPDHRHDSSAEAADTTPWSARLGRQLQALVGPQTARLIENLRLQARLQPASAPTRIHVPSAAAHHHHGVFARHHHAADDASLVLSGARADGQSAADAALAGAMAMPLAPTSALAMALPAVHRMRWPVHAAPAWHNHVPGLPERPPSA